MRRHALRIVAGCQTNTGGHGERLACGLPPGQYPKAGRSGERHYDEDTGAGR